MTFSRFVEIGRVALIRFGPNTGKLCVIIDIIDQNRALVDGPFSLTGVERQQMPFSRLALTDFKLAITRSPRESVIAEAAKKADLMNKWNATAWAKKLSMRAKRASYTDFERFKMMMDKKKRSVAVNTAFNKLKKSA